MVIEVKTAGVTVRVVEPLIEPKVAVIVVVATPTPLTVLPLAMAAETLEDVQVAKLVRFCVLPSVYVPVAVNC